MAGVELDFGRWMALAFPIAIAGGVLVVTVCVRAFPAPVDKIEGLGDEVDRQLTELGPLTRGELRAIMIFGLAVLGWLAPSLLRVALGADHTQALWAKATLKEGVVAIACAGLMFATPSGVKPGERIVDNTALQRVDWSTLILLGGGLALGRLMVETRLAEAIGVGMVDFAGPVVSHPLGLMAVSALLVIFMTEFTSNTATTAMMLPVLISVAQAANYDPTPTAVIVTLAASYAFMLPVSTPPNAMAYGTSLIQMGAMIRVGFRLDLLGYAVLMAFGVTLVPLIVG